MTGIKDRVKETTTTTGAGTLTLAGTVTGFRRFQDAFLVGGEVHYAIELGAQWEVGKGTLVTPTTLSRTTVFASSNADSLVSFSVGIKLVWSNLEADYAYSKAELGNAGTNLGADLIGFVQSGSTPRTRTVQAKEREIVSVLDYLPIATTEGYGATTDWAAAFTAALAASDAVFVPRTTTIDGDTGQTIYRLDSTVTVNDDQKIYIDRGVILRRYSIANGGSAATTPVLFGKGIGWEIEGGTIQTQNASPSGVVRCGHESSSSDYNAWWWRLQNCTVLGATSITAGDIGIYVPSGQVTNALKTNYFGVIQNVNIKHADIGLYLDEMANAHNVSNMQYWSCKTANLRIRGAYANNVTNQFFHTGFADGAIGIDIVNKSAGTQAPIANNIIGFTVETGGANDVPVKLGTEARHNVIIGNCNTTFGPTNNATNENTLLLGMTGAVTHLPSNLVVGDGSARGTTTSRGNVGLSLSAGTATGGAGDTIQLLTHNSTALQVEILHASLAVNSIQMTGGATSTNPRIGTNGENLVLGSGAAISTTATAGHILIPSCAGTPTGVPTGQGAGAIPMIFDTSGVKLWLYTGGVWKGVVVA